VCVEVHLANGLPSFTLVGLADTEVKEARDGQKNISCQSREGECASKKRPLKLSKFSNLKTHAIAVNQNPSHPEKVRSLISTKGDRRLAYVPAQRTWGRVPVAIGSSVSHRKGTLRAGL